MVNIRGIEVLNYRSCLDTKIQLNNDLTALIGVNGVGKTNILNSLMLLNKSVLKRTYSIDKNEDFNNVSIIKLLFDFEGERIQFKIEVQYEIGDNNDDIIDFYLAYYKTTSAKHWTEISVNNVEHAIRARNNLDKMVSKLKIARFHKEVEAKHREAVMDIIEMIFDTSYYSATQFSNPSLCPLSLELEENRAFRPFKRDPYYKFMLDLYDSYKSNSKGYKQFISTVNQEGIGLIDDIKFFDHPMTTSSFQVKSGGVIQAVERTKFIIIPSVVVDGMALSPNQLSDGTFKTLALLFYILNDSSRLLLVEEPEVGVHHGLLGSIIELIKIQSRYKQIIVSTHSDYILDKLAPENVVLVQKLKDIGTKAIPLTKHLSRNDYQGLKDYLDNTGNLGEYWKDMGFNNG